MLVTFCLSTFLSCMCMYAPVAMVFKFDKHDTWLNCYMPSKLLHCLLLWDLTNSRNRMACCRDKWFTVCETFGITIINPSLSLYPVWCKYETILVKTWNVEHTLLKGIFLSASLLLHCELSSNFQIIYSGSEVKVLFYTGACKVHVYSSLNFWGLWEG